ncbi:DUF393 domain-containing protein [Paenibacillus lycopersici]|uniref:DUF393 domain-containing protein n=1 Tax=Paenibacillus lycopersici TaxID=2704462 RepID=A0A6C0G139_9BACL|nr:DUF393 domain-containing protein [Paenibacillus lycopersici]QHT60929.1 DUF393 domain-containing protein [Paenibacillus lycopersici]
MKRTSSGEETDCVILIDGECPLCHRMARFVSKRDAAGRFRFAALRSTAGRRLLAECGMSGGFADPADGETDGPTSGEAADTFVLIENGRCFTRSTGALRVLRKLDGLWPLMYGAVMLPAVIRDGVYKLIARSRYRIFGRGRGSNVCELPDVRLRDRWIVDAEADGPGKR